MALVELLEEREFSKHFRCQRSWNIRPTMREQAVIWQPRYLSPTGYCQG